MSHSRLSLSIIISILLLVLCICAAASDVGHSNRITARSGVSVPDSPKSRPAPPRPVKLPVNTRPANTQSKMQNVPTAALYEDGTVVVHKKKNPALVDAPIITPLKMTDPKEPAITHAVESEAPSHPNKAQRIASGKPRNQGIPKYSSDPDVLTTSSLKSVVSDVSPPSTRGGVAPPTPRSRPALPRADNNGDKVPHIRLPPPYQAKQAPPNNSRRIIRDAITGKPKLMMKNPPGSVRNKVAGTGPPSLPHRIKGGVNSPIENSKEFHPHEAKPYHLHVGTASALDDVIADDIVKQGWNVADDGESEASTPNNVPADKDFSDFYLYRTFMVGDAPKRTITGQKPYFFVNNTEILSIKLIPFGPRHVTPIPLIDEKEEKAKLQASAVEMGTSREKPQHPNELLFTLQYECHKAGPALVTVIIRAFELTLRARSTNTFTWSFVKMCAAPTDSAKEVNPSNNAAIPGLSIGTSAQAANMSDVVEHGEAKPEWTIGGGVNGETRLKTFDKDIEGVKLWLRYDPHVVHQNLTVNQAVFVIDDPTLLVVEHSGDLAEQQTILLPDRTFTLSMTFTCKKQGSSDVTVLLNFPSAGQKISFSFRKKCSGLVASDGATMNGIDIWTDDEKDNKIPDVVVNGVVQPQWRPIQKIEEEPNLLRTVVADKETDHMTFFMKLKQGYHTVEYDPPIVTSYTSEGELILRPRIYGSIDESSNIKQREQRFFVVEFNCIKSGFAVVTVKLPFRPNGQIQFNMRKMCEVKTEDQKIAATFVQEYSTDQLTPLPGFHIGIKMSPADNKRGNVVADGIPQPHFHWETNVNQLVNIRAKYPWVNFNMWKDPKTKDAVDVRFGRPELIATADIARPVISGLGAEGGVITDNEFSTLTITFHCFAPGNTTMTLIIPLIDDEWLNTQTGETIKIKPPRADPIKISFVRECTSASEGIAHGMGGVGINGFHIGYTPTGSELVLNGFPLPKYYGQRTSPHPNWEDIKVPPANMSTTLFVHYDSDRQNSNLESEIMYQPPVVACHDPTARPSLAGEASLGGTIAKNAIAVPLDLTYNCRYKGLAVITIIFPIIPHGQISITIPKQCEGPDAPHGQKVSGLNVGLTRGSSEIVRDGMTDTKYMSYASRRRQDFIVQATEDMTTFWIFKTGAAVRGIEPIAHAHQSIVSLQVSHSLLLNSSEIDTEGDGDEIEINEEISPINITYACVQPGSVDITLKLSLLPVGSVQWTWTKICADVFVDVDTESEGDKGLFDKDEEEPSYLRWASVIPGLTKPTKTVSRFTDVDEEEEEENDFLQPSSDPEWVQEDSPNPMFDKYDEHAGMPDQDRVKSSLTTAHSFHIGTSELEPADVFNNAMPTRRYRMSAAAVLDVQNFAIIKPEVLTSIFYLSTTAASQEFFTPTINLDTKYQRFLKPVIEGDAKQGGVIRAGEKPMKLELTYNCIKGGVFAIPVTIRLNGGNIAPFRVIKICGNYEVKEQEFYWTAGRALSFLGLLVALVGLGVGIYYFRVASKKSLTNAMYPTVVSATDDS